MTDRISNSDADAAANGGGGDAIGDLIAHLQELRDERRRAIEAVKSDAAFETQQRRVLDARAANLGLDLIQLADDYLGLRESAENSAERAAYLHLEISLDDQFDPLDLFDPLIRTRDAEAVTKALAELNATQSRAAKWAVQLMRDGDALMDALLPDEGSTE